MELLNNLNLFLNFNFLITDYINYLSMVVFISILLLFIFILLFYVYYIFIYHPILKNIIMCILCLFVACITAGIIISAIGTIIWPCLVFASNLKDTIMNKFNIPELLVDISSLFISFGLIFSAVGIIIKKGYDNI